MSKDIKFFKLLVVLNTFISIALTLHIILYNIDIINQKNILVIVYALVWFFSLYKIYNFALLGLKIYISLVIMGFFFNIISNIQVLGKFYYVVSLLEHIIIGAILAFIYFSKVKSKFK